MLQLKQYQNLKEKIKPPLVLLSTSGHLELRKIDEPKLGGVFVDFVSRTITHRRHFGGGCKEAIAKAVGIKGSYLPNVLDATAGLGRDSFILAAIGCRVLMLERHPVVLALLNDGLQRGFAHSEIGGWLRERLKLLHILSQQKLNEIKSTLDVVYLDPMYPFRQKSAKVKKEMRLLQLLVGIDEDADTLLEPARRLAQKRVVVKRPQYAPPLAGMKTNSNIITKNHRFDIYLPL